MSHLKCTNVVSGEYHAARVAQLTTELTTAKNENTKLREDFRKINLLLAMHDAAAMPEIALIVHHWVK